MLVFHVHVREIKSGREASMERVVSLTKGPTKLKTDRIFFEVSTVLGEKKDKLVSHG